MFEVGSHTMANPPDQRCPSKILMEPSLSLSLSLSLCVDQERERDRQLDMERGQWRVLREGSSHVAEYTCIFSSFKEKQAVEW
jgi:hypothetical protein